MGILIELIKKRLYQDNKNFLCVAIGPVGSGKSWGSISLAEQIDPTFNIDRIIFNPSEFMKRMTPEELKSGQCYVFEEVGVILSSRNWQSIYNKAIGAVLQTFRRYNVAVFFTVPSFSFVDIQARSLFHALLIPKSIDIKQGVCRTKIQFLQCNPITGKIYRKNLRVLKDGRWVKVPTVIIKKPSKELINQYEKKKKTFTDKIMRTMKIEIDAKMKGRKTDGRKIYKCQKCGHTWQSQHDNLPVRCPGCGTRRYAKKTFE